MIRDEWRKELRKSMTAKERMAIKRVVMPMEDPIERLKGNTEVNKGLSVFEAVKEAQRCLDCANPPCIQGCPVGVDIPTFIKYIEAGDFLKSAQVIKQSNLFPAICGRVCPQEVQCEKNCIYFDKLNKEPVAIGYLERFVADYERESGTTYIPEIGKISQVKVAVVGSGPAGIAAAGDLARYGYQVSVYEALHELGGVLRYGIPEFRLPNHIIEFEIDNLKKIGVKFYTNIIIGKTLSHDDLKESGYKAFFIGSGAGLPKFMNIPGENHVGIMSANEYLTRINLMGAAKQDYDTPVFYGRNVAVIGGGNTAMDSVRTAKRLGAERAMIIYRRSFNEMPARKEEIKHAMEEGVEFLNLNEPVEYLADENGRVNRIKLRRMELGEPDASGRCRPVPLKDSEYSLQADMVIVSIGVSPNPLISMHMPELKVTPSGTIEVCGELMKANVEGFYAGGDIVRGGATVIAAMGDGRKAAFAIHRYLSGI